MSAASKVRRATERRVGAREGLCPICGKARGSDPWWMVYRNQWVGACWPCFRALNLTRYGRLTPRVGEEGK